LVPFINILLAEIKILLFFILFLLLLLIGIQKSHNKQLLDEDVEVKENLTKLRIRV